MNARDRLAQAHQVMTPEEIAAHALELAEVLEATDKALASTYRAADSSRRAWQQIQSTFSNLVIGVRQAQSLIASHRKREGRKMLAKIASVVAPLPTEPLDVPEHRPLSENWPDAFIPKGTAHGHHE